MIEGAFVSLGLEDFFFECIANRHINIPAVIIIIRMTTPIIVPPIMAPVLLLVATKNDEILLHTL